MKHHIKKYHPGQTPNVLGVPTRYADTYHRDTGIGSKFGNILLNRSGEEVPSQGPMPYALKHSSVQ